MFWVWCKMTSVGWVGGIPISNHHICQQPPEWEPWPCGRIGRPWPRKSTRGSTVVQGHVVVLITSSTRTMVSVLIFVHGRLTASHISDGQSWMLEETLGLNGMPFIFWLWKEMLPGHIDLIYAPKLQRFVDFDGLLFETSNEGLLFDCCKWGEYLFFFVFGFRPVDVISQVVLHSHICRPVFAQIITLWRLWYLQWRVSLYGHWVRHRHK